MNDNMRVLIAYDGSSCADAALADLQRAGLPRFGVEATVISVAEVWLPPPPPSIHEVVELAQAAETPADLRKRYSETSSQAEEARTLSLRAQKRLRQNFPEWSILAEATTGSPAWEVILKADQWKPDLIVVGSQGRSAFGRFVLGSVSQKVLTEARSSVRVARGRVEVEESPVRIIIGVDGSPGCEAAVRQVARRLWPHGSEARVVVVVEDPLVPTAIGRLVPPVTKWVEESNRVDRAWVRRIADKAVETLRSGELNASPVIREGDPKRVLIEEAETWGADCIFVGSTGFGNRFERFLLGSISAAVAARAHCSVEVVRESKVADEDTPSR
jgi:nucleotide-binding universal stress UspA family protein